MKTVHTAIILFVAGLFLFSVTVRGVPGNPLPTSIKNNLDQAGKPLELSPERGRYVLIMSLAENGSFALSPVLADAADPDIGYSKGKFYIYFGPGISLLALPFYTIGKHFQLAQVFSFLTISIFAALNLVFIFLIARHILKLKSWASLASAVLFGFCSPAWSYANTLYQHHVTTFIILSCVYAVWQYKQQKAVSWIWMMYAWLAFGFSLFIDYPNAILIAPVIVYAFFTSFSISQKDSTHISMSFRTAFLTTSIIFILINVIHGYYNHTQFGSWSKLSGGLVGIKELKRYKLLNNPQAESIIEKMSQEKNVARFFEEKNVVHGFSILLFSRDRGLFLYAPVFIFGILGIVIKLKRINLEVGTLLGLLGTHIFLYSSWGDPWGGWAFGPRYLIPSIAILSLFAGIWMNTYLRHWWARFLVFIPAVFSSGVGLLGALTTNAIPPKIEADYLKMQYNFLRNYQFMLDDNSSSYIFNTYLSNFIALPQFYALLWIMVLTLLVLLLFLFPKWDTEAK